MGADAATEYVLKRDRLAPLGAHAGRAGGGLLAAAGLAVMVWG